MLENNTKQVNYIIAKTLMYCSAVFIALLLLKIFGVFNFRMTTVLIIGIVGLITTFSPMLLIKLKVNDRFLQYYMLAMISIVIGTLGSDNGIGIYITYVAVPLISCLYFDQKFTLRTGIIAYITMVIGVYINTDGKLERTAYGWSHMQTFISYLIGFTLEFIVIMLFLNQIVKRCKAFMQKQYDMVIGLQNKMAKRQLSDVYMDSMNRDRNSIYDTIMKESADLGESDFEKLSEGHQFTAEILDLLKYATNLEETIYDVFEQIGNYFGIDRIGVVETSYTERVTRLMYQWNSEGTETIEAFSIKMNAEDIDAMAKRYDATGYLEVFASENDVEIRRVLGAQIWIPTLEAGKYNGSIFFDKKDETPYTIVEKFVLSEVVSTMSAYISRLNAENSNKAKSIFLSNMSHEIRTPMNAILGMSEVALRQDMNDEAKRCINIIRSSSKGLLSIINEILDFSKIEAGKLEIVPERYNTLALLNDVKVIVQASNAKKKLGLTFHVPDDLPTSLRGDVVSLKQVMVNLSNNAIKYTEKGSVDIYVECEKISAENVKIRFRVKDTGKGIKKEDIGKLFSTFSQVDTKKNHHIEGTGLGLAICKQLVELMDGNIGVDSVYGEGSTFYFEVPQELVDETPAGALDDYEYETETTSKNDLFRAPKARILLADDNQINRAVAQALFKPLQFTIETATNGEEALNMAKEKQYDLILMDHFMPAMDGEESTQEIRKLEGNVNQNVPIIALTADAVKGVKEHLIEVGMNDFISKPIDMKVACKVMRKWLPDELIEQ